MEVTQNNPATTPAMNVATATTPVVTPRKRIPMSIPTRKLEVPDMPGYRLYWFKGENVPRALQAGYEFVKDQEVSLNRIDIGGAPGVSGNTDLGSNVSIVAGRQENGEPERLILMKLKLEYHLEDQKQIADRNAKVLESIFKDERIVGPEGQAQEKDSLTYVDKSRTAALFNRPVRKAKIVR